MAVAQPCLIDLSCRISWPCGQRGFRQFTSLVGLTRNTPTLLPRQHRSAESSKKFQAAPAQARLSVFRAASGGSAGGSFPRGIGVRKNSPSAADTGFTQVPNDLLEHLLQTEAQHLALDKMHPVSMHGVLDAVQPHRAAKFMHLEIPKRYAQQLRMIETLEAWESVPELKKMHQLLQDWFKQLRLVRRGRDVGLKDFTVVVNTIKDEGKICVRLVTLGMYRLRNMERLGYTDNFVDRWLDDFLVMRTSVSMLINQYIAVTKVIDGGLGQPTGIVRLDCCPTSVCHAALTVAGKLCQTYTGKRPPSKIETFVAGKRGPQTESHKITYIPGYLRYIMLEILKNSFAATAKNAEDEEDLRERPIHIVVSLDEENCAIRVSDRAGGIPHSVMPRIFSYLYGAAARSDPGEPDATATPLSGFGVGLPLGRLHARYLGGDLRITSFPGFGTDVFLHLPTISANQVEELP